MLRARTHTPALARSARSAQAAGFTLVELMIAIALMLIITLQLQIIFNGSRTMFLRAEALVEVFQNARSAVDLIERDLANAVTSDQMEFFRDIRTRSIGVGHMNQDEMLPELRNSFFQGVNYVHNLAMKQPPEYRPLMAIDGGPYRRDGLYFRTFTTVNGVGKEALVQYRLTVGPDPTRPRPLPILQRRLTEVERITTAGDPVVRRHDWMDVCYYVQEFKVEAFLRDRSFGSVGRFYSPRQAAQGGASGTDVRAPNLQRMGGPEDGVGVVFIEQGEGQLATTGILTVTQTVNTSARPLQNLAPGDRMYLLTQPLPGQTFQTDFGGYMTIKEIDRVTTPGQTKVHFEQSVTLQNAMAGIGATSVTARFRAAFMPSALRITMLVKDSRSSELRTIQRIFRVGS